MRFIDEATIEIAGGHGGPGCVSFRREKFIPRGGPDGGDGGAGGSVTFISTVQLGTLQDFRFKRTYHAGAGEHGSGVNKAGKDGQSITVKVPVGTVIRDAESGEVLFDFIEDNMVWLACKGGRGGKGNTHFVSSTFQVPKFAQPGEDGQKLSVKLELKLLADVALIGYPNAGKSSLIAKASAARPKIADYAFTTLTPNLGVVSLSDYRSFVMADIPGLIEGAHKGVGLGHRFLKHIERTHVLVHLLDGAELLEIATRPSEEDVTKTLIEYATRIYTNIRNELGLYNPALIHKREILIIHKSDLFPAGTGILEKVQLALHQGLASIRPREPMKSEPFLVSSATGEGLTGLLEAVYSELTQEKFKYMQETLLPDDESLRRESKS